MAAAGLFPGVEHLRRDLWAPAAGLQLGGPRRRSELRRFVAGVGTAAAPLDHYWSLAIEEQFYWVWPLALFGVLRLRGRGAGSRCRRWWSRSPPRRPLIAWRWGADAAYWATPARLAEIVGRRPARRPAARRL